MNMVKHIWNNMKYVTSENIKLLFSFSGKVLRFYGISESKDERQKMETLTHYSFTVSPVQLLNV